MSRGWRFIALSLSLVSGACNSDVPELAVMESKEAGLRVTVIRVATHPFLARYNMKMRVERPDGCIAASELFPDTGQAGRRNLYLTSSGALLLVGQFDARILQGDRCVIELLEFHHMEKGGRFLGSFDIDQDKRWRFIPSDVRAEQSFERP